MIHLVSFSAVTWNFPLIGRTRMLTEAWQRLGIPTTFVQIPFGRSALERFLPFGRAYEPVRVVRPWPTYPRWLWARLSPARLHASIARRARELRRQLDRVIDWDEAAAVEHLARMLGDAQAWQSAATRVRAAAHPDAASAVVGACERLLTARGRGEAREPIKAAPTRSAKR